MIMVTLELSSEGAGRKINSSNCNPHDRGTLDELLKKKYVKKTIS